MPQVVYYVRGNKVKLLRVGETPCPELLTCPKAEVRQYLAERFGVERSDVVSQAALNRKSKKQNPNPFGAPKVVQGAVRRIGSRTRQWLATQEKLSTQIYDWLISETHAHNARCDRYLNSRLPERAKLWEQIRALARSRTGKSPEECDQIEKQIVALKQQSAKLCKDVFTSNEYNQFHRDSSARRQNAWETILADAVDCKSER